jgi:ABC-type transport system involved in cytochrome bd biosynthesis fused ATPase/permease subunit
VRAIGCLLMISGWLIVLAALVLLHGLGQRYGFVVAGVAVEVLGLVLLAQRYRAEQMPRKEGQ